MTEISKKKTFVIQLSSWVTMALVVFAALFSPDGMAIPAGGFVAGLAQILSHFVTVLNILVIFLVAAISFLVWLGLKQEDDGFIKQSVDKLVEQKGVLEAGKKLQFKKTMFFLVTLPFWCVLIASGWIFTVLIWALLSAAFQTMTFFQRQYYKETYLNEPDKETKDEDDLTDSGLDLSADD